MNDATGQATQPNELRAWAEKVLRLLAPLHPEQLPALDFRNPFELLVATILSAQCTDARVNRTTPALFARFPDAAALAAASRDGRALAELEALVHSTGFFRAKARNLSLMAAALEERHGGRVPATMDELTALAGVGRKTAGVILSVCWGAPAIVVDTHFGRVARRIGLARETDPVKLEAEIAAFLPEKLWNECGRLLNLHGRKICRARAPDCGKCPVDACPTRSNR